MVAKQPRQCIYHAESHPTWRLRTYWASSDIKATRRLILKQGHKKVNDRKREVRTKGWQSHTWMRGEEGGGSRGPDLTLKTRSVPGLVLETGCDVLDEVCLQTHAHTRVGNKGRGGGGRFKSHIIGGRSSSSIQKGVFRPSTFTFPCLSFSTSSTPSTTLRFSTTDSTLQGRAAGGAAAAEGSDAGEEKGLGGLRVVSSLCFSSSVSSSSFNSCCCCCCFVSPALGGREGRGRGSACAETTALERSDRAKISRKHSEGQGWITGRQLMCFSRPRVQTVCFYDIQITN